MQSSLSSPPTSEESPFVPGTFLYELTAQERVYAFPQVSAFEIPRNLVQTPWLYRSFPSTAHKPYQSIYSTQPATLTQQPRYQGLDHTLPCGSHFLSQDEYSISREFRDARTYPDTRLPRKDADDANDDLQDPSDNTNETTPRAHIYNLQIPTGRPSRQPSSSPLISRDPPDKFEISKTSE